MDRLPEWCPGGSVASKPAKERIIYLFPIFLLVVQSACGLLL
jgi:hypothetical protein